MAHEPLQTARMVAVKPLGDLLSVAELKTDTTSGYAEDAERR